MNKIARPVACLVLSIALSVSPAAVAATQPSDLSPIATETALLFGGGYSEHVQRLERLLSANGLGFGEKKRSSMVEVLHGMKKDFAQYIDVANTISRSVRFYGKTELLLHAMNLYATLSQALYSCMLFDEAVVERLPDTAAKAEFKLQRDAFRDRVMSQQKKCLDYAFGLMSAR